MSNVNRSGAHVELGADRNGPRDMIFVEQVCVGGNSFTCSVCLNPDCDHGVKLWPRGQHGFHLICEPCVKSMGLALDQVSR